MLRILFFAHNYHPGVRFPKGSGSLIRHWKAQSYPEAGNSGQRLTAEALSFIEKNKFEPDKLGDKRFPAVTMARYIFIKANKSSTRSRYQTWLNWSEG